MNYKEVTFMNKKSGKYKTAPTGFSWTTFVMSFIYNKLYMKDLLKNGFVPSTEGECKFLIKKGIATEEQIDFLIESI